MATVEAQVPQHMVALRRANQVRLAGVAVKAEVRDGTMSLRDALRDERAASVTILDLLMAQRRWGRTSALMVLRKARITETRRVRELTERQCDEIADRCGSAR